MKNPKAEGLAFYLEAHNKHLVSRAVTYKTLQTLIIPANKAALQPVVVQLKPVVALAVQRGDFTAEQLGLVKELWPDIWNWWAVNKGLPSDRDTWLDSLKAKGSVNVAALIEAQGTSYVLERLTLRTRSANYGDEWNCLVSFLVEQRKSDIADLVRDWMHNWVEVNLASEDPDLFKQLTARIETLRQIDAEVNRRFDKLEGGQGALARLLWAEGKKHLIVESDYAVLVKFLLPEQGDLEARILETQKPIPEFLKSISLAGQAWLIEKFRPDVWKELGIYLTTHPTLLAQIDTGVLNRIVEHLIRTRAYVEVELFSKALLEQSETAESYEFSLLKLGEAALLRRDYDQGLTFAQTLYSSGPNFVAREAVDRLVVQLKYLQGDFAGAYDAMLQMYARSPRSIDPELASRLAAFTGNSFESQLFQYMGEVK